MNNSEKYSQGIDPLTEALAYAAPIERVTLESAINRADVGERIPIGRIDTVQSENLRSLSGEAVSRTVGFADSAEIEFQHSPEAISAAVGYVIQVGKLTKANRENAMRTMTREDFDIAS